MDLFGRTDKAYGRRRFDHGHLYASKSFYDARNKRRGLTRPTAAALPEAGLASRRSRGRCGSTPTEGLCAEKGASVHGGVGPFGLLLLASGDLEEHTAVFFRVFRHLGTYKVLMCTDLTKSSKKAGVHKPYYGAFLDVDVEKGKFISLRTLIDHTVVESFGDGGRTCMTARVYPKHAAPGSCVTRGSGSGSTLRGG